jgi:hypothetical protein
MIPNARAALRHDPIACSCVTRISLAVRLAQKA